MREDEEMRERERESRWEDSEQEERKGETLSSRREKGDIRRGDLEMKEVLRP
jgi:hypothetical protein